MDDAPRLTFVPNLSDTDPTRFVSRLDWYCRNGYVIASVAVRVQYYVYVTYYARIESVGDAANQLAAATGALAASVAANSTRPTKETHAMASQQTLDDLKADVTKAVTVETSAKVLIDGFAARMQAGIDAALANGATAAQLAPLTDLTKSLNAESDALAASVAANTGP